MKIRTNIEILDGRYRVTLDTYDLSAMEKENFGAFGEPLVDAGGEFEGDVTRPGEDNPTSVSFELPAAHYRIPSDFPYTSVFDTRDSSDSDLMAKLYAETMVSRITSTKNEALERSKVFVGETIITV